MVVLRGVATDEAHEEEVDDLVDAHLVFARVEPVLDAVEVAVDDALDARLLADLAQGGDLVGLAGLDPALGQSPHGAAGRPDQTELENVAGARHHAACRELVSDLHAVPLGPAAPQARPLICG